MLRLFYTSKYHNGTYRKCGEKAVSSSSISEGISGNRQGFGSNSKKFLSILQKPVLRLGIPSLRSSMTEKKGNVILNRRDSGVVKNPATPAVLFVPVERMDPSAMPQDDERKSNWCHPDVEHRGTEGSGDAFGITSFLQNDWILRLWLRMTGGTEGSSDALGITSFLQNDWILRFVNTPLRMTGKGATLPAAVVAATVMATTLTAMPTEAEAATGCSALTSSSSLTDVINCLKAGNLALGSYNTTSESASIAQGYQNTASQQDSIALGIINTASGIGAIALGRYNTANGYYSTALGHYNTASGSYSSAVGFQSNVAKNYTTAIGYQAVANVAGTTSQGIISVGHKNGDPKGWEAGNYPSDYFSKIINVANGTDDHDAATVGQMNTALNNYYTKV